MFLFLLFFSITQTIYIIILRQSWINYLTIRNPFLSLQRKCFGCIAEFMICLLLFLHEWTECIEIYEKRENCFRKKIREKEREIDYDNNEYMTDIT